MKTLRLKKFALILSLAAALIICGACGSGQETKSDQKADQTQEETKEEKSEDKREAQKGETINVTVKMVHQDGTVKELHSATDYVMLGDLLRDEELVQGIESEETGLYITEVDGEAADEKNQEWWMVNVNGEMAMTGVDQIEMHDGDVFELVFTVGYY